jgi:predicted DNA-binding transcriptional regulator AlpA
MNTEINKSDPILVTEPEAAYALGVSPGTLKAARLHRLQSNPLRDLPHVRLGRSVRYRKQDIIQWIERNTVFSESPVGAA